MTNIKELNPAGPYTLIRLRPTRPDGELPAWHFAVDAEGASDKLEWPVNASDGLLRQSIQ